MLCVSLLDSRFLLPLSSVEEKRNCSHIGDLWVAGGEIKPRVPRFILPKSILKHSFGAKTEGSNISGSREPNRGLCGFFCFLEKYRESSHITCNNDDNHDKPFNG